MQSHQSSLPILFLRELSNCIPELDLLFTQHWEHKRIQTLQKKQDTAGRTLRLPLLLIIDESKPAMHGIEQIERHSMAPTSFHGYTGSGEGESYVSQEGPNDEHLSCKYSQAGTNSVPQQALMSSGAQGAPTATLSAVMVVWIAANGSWFDV